MSRCLVLVSCFAVLAAAPAHATVMERMSVPQLTAAASTIAEARVVAQRTLLLNGDPWTETRIRVITSLKGEVDRGTDLTLRQIGGVVGRRGLRLSGAAHFSRNERVFVFLRPVGRHFVTVGMSQGKFEVYRDARGTLRAKQDLSGVAFAHGAGTGGTGSSKVVIVPEVRLVGVADRSLRSLAAQVRQALTNRSGQVRGKSPTEGGGQ